MLSDDIVVVDTDSNDNTVALARKAGARVINQEWRGYGYARNLGAEKAKNDWIISLDADERVTPKLARTIKKTNLSNNHLYQFNRDNFIGLRLIRFGTAGFDKVIRLYNRNYASWDLTVVHEKLNGNCSVKKITGSLRHYSMKDIADYREKSVIYAKLSAQKYYAMGKQAGFIKRYISPGFNSIKSYIFQLGFLDGKTGFHLARAIAHYTWLKYEFLHQLSLQQERSQTIAFPLRKAEKTAPELLSLEK